MSDEVFFREEQRFRQPWLWIILLLTFVAGGLPIGYGIIQQLVLGRAWGNRPMPNGGLIVLGVVMALFWIGMFAKPPPFEPELIALGCRSSGSGCSPSSPWAADHGGSGRRGVRAIHPVPLLVRADPLGRASIVGGDDL